MGRGLWGEGGGLERSVVVGQVGQGIRSTGDGVDKGWDIAHAHKNEHYGIGWV